MSNLKSRGLFLRKPGELELAEVDVDDLLGDPARTDMLIVETMACGICGSDLRYYQGENPWALHTLGINMPIDPNMILGHEIAGTIKDVRMSSDETRNGQAVGIIAFKECGECIDCVEGRHNLCGFCDHHGHGELREDGTRNSWRNFKYVPGGFSDYFTCWHEKAIPLSENISFQEATQLDGLAVATHAGNRVQVPIGGTILVLGTGPIGFLAAQVAFALGAGKVITTDLYEKPFEVLQKVADGWKTCQLETININKKDPIAEVLKSTNHYGADAVIDTIGDATTVPTGLKALKRGGRMVILGGLIEEIDGFKISWLSGERIITSSANNLFPEYPQALSMLRDGKVSIKPMITHTFKLDDYQEAFNVALNKEETGAVKVIIEP